VRTVYAHPKKEHAPVVAALPPQVIPQAGVGPGFIAHVLIAKYVDHLPLYRQERIDARGGVWISRQARCRYVEAAAHLLITIRSLLINMILGNGYVQVDETFTKLMDPDRRGRSHDAYLWGYLAPLVKAVVFEFSPSRSGAILHDFFPARWMGIVQTDGAAMYPSAFKHRPSIIHLECMAHLRRYVLDAIKSDEHQALPLLKDITELYRIEREAKERGLTHEQRGYLRHAKAKPVLKGLQAKFRALERTAPPSGKLREAVTYANNRWRHLVRYAKVGFGHVHIDNNPIEGTFRPTKVGLRNYLFIGHPAAGWRSTSRRSRTANRYPRLDRVRDETLLMRQFVESGKRTRLHFLTRVEGDLRVQDHLAHPVHPFGELAQYAFGRIPIRLDLGADPKGHMQPRQHVGARHRGHEQVLRVELGFAAITVR